MSVLEFLVGVLVGIVLTVFVWIGIDWWSDKQMNDRFRK